MKPSVAVSLIIMGTILVLAPFGADYCFQRNLVLLLSKENSINATVIPQLTTWYRVICLVMGSLMVLFGALVSADPRAGYYAEPEEEFEEEDKNDEK
jgi:hypothetical protein